MFRIAICLSLLLGSMLAQNPPAGCKPVTRYGVTGCEVLPDQSCPPGYHKQVVDPPDPRMKAPSYMMCVPDKPQKEKPKQQSPPAANQPEK